MITDSIFINRLRRGMFDENNGFLILVAGKQRTGKSWGSLYLALRITGYGETWFRPDIGTEKALFDVDYHIIFKGVDFLKVINNPDLKQGSVIIWDDCGVGLSADKFYDLMNQTIGAVLQPICEKNLTIIFTTPQPSLVIKKVRKLFHYLIETHAINRHNRVIETKLFEIEPAIRRDETYFKSIWANLKTEKGEEEVKIDKYILGCPPVEFSTPYRQRRKKWDDWLNDRALKKAEEIEEVEDDIDRLHRLAGKIVDRRSDFVREYRGREFVDEDVVAIEFKLSQMKARRVRRMAEKLLKLGQK